MFYNDEVFNFVINLIEIILVFDLSFALKWQMGACLPIVNCDLLREQVKSSQHFTQFASVSHRTRVLFLRTCSHFVELCSDGGVLHILGLLRKSVFDLYCALSFMKHAQAEIFAWG